MSPVSAASAAGLVSLCFAGQQGHLDIAKLLLCSRATVDMTTHGAVTPLLIAVENGHEEVVQFLLESRESLGKTGSAGAHF